MHEQGDPENTWFTHWKKGGTSQLSNAGYVNKEEDQDALIEKFKNPERWAVDGCHLLMHTSEGRAILCRKSGGTLSKKNKENNEIVEIKYVKFERKTDQVTFRRFYLTVQTLLPMLEALKRQPHKRWKFPLLLIYGEHQLMTPSEN